MVDKEHPLAKTANSLRASASAPPPAADSPPPNSGQVVQRIEARQVQVVDAIGQALNTIGEVVGELRTSVDEDERVRKEVRELTGQVGKLRTQLRTAVYACVGLVCVAVGVSVYTNIKQLELSRIGSAQVAGAVEKIDAIDANAARILQVILKQADAHAKSVEAEAALTPQAEHDALEAAIEVQEDAAQAQIEVAAQRRVAPPPEAREALQKARRKKAELSGARYPMNLSVE